MEQLTDQPVLYRGPGKQTLHLTVNGMLYELLIDPRRTLLDVLRVELALNGAKPVCGQGHCGACTVFLNGEAVYSCIVLALECEGSQVTTVEGLAPAGSLHPVQEAFLQEDALQCGICTPGQIMAAVALLKANPSPSEAEILQGMAGNLCRCGAYLGIVRAIMRAAPHASLPNKPSETRQ